jgi:NADP-dependent alcohol dehydrogenase
VLITYGGGSLVKTGTLAEVKAALGETGYLELGGIEPNPTD